MLILAMCETKKRVRQEIMTLEDATYFFNRKFEALQKRIEDGKPISRGAEEWYIDEYLEG